MHHCKKDVTHKNKNYLIVLYSLSFTFYIFFLKDKKKHPLGYSTIILVQYGSLLVWLDIWIRYILHLMRSDTVLCYILCWSIEPTFDHSSKVLQMLLDSKVHNEGFQQTRSNIFLQRTQENLNARNCLWTSCSDGFLGIRRSFYSGQCLCVGQKFWIIKWFFGVVEV